MDVPLIYIHTHTPYFFEVDIIIVMIAKNVLLTINQNKLSLIPKLFWLPDAISKTFILVLSVHDRNISPAGCAVKLCCGCSSVRPIISWAICKLLIVLDLRLRGLLYPYTCLLFQDGPAELSLGSLYPSVGFIETNASVFRLPMSLGHSGLGKSSELICLMSSWDLFRASSTAMANKLIFNTFL